MDWLATRAKKLGWPIKATYYSHSDYNKCGRMAWRAAMLETFNFVQEAMRQKRARDEAKAKVQENALTLKRARLLLDQRSLTASDASSPSHQVDTDASASAHATDASSSANASAVPEAYATASLPVTANASATAPTTVEVTAGAATDPGTEFDVGASDASSPSHQVDTDASASAHATDASSSANASAVPEAYATASLPVTANASATAPTTVEVTAGAATDPEPRFDVPTTVTLLHAGLLQLRATIHQLGYGGQHPSHGYADVFAQQALQTHVTDLLEQVATLKEHGLDKDTDKDA